jgi:hypothetical protein
MLVPPYYGWKPLFRNAMFWFLVLYPYPYLYLYLYLYLIIAKAIPEVYFSASWFGGFQHLISYRIALLFPSISKTYIVPMFLEIPHMLTQNANMLWH